MKLLTKCSLILQILITSACVGKEFTARDTSKDAGGDTAGTESSGNPRGEDYAQCCVLDHACMIELESEKPEFLEPDASTSDAGITNTN